MTKKTIFISFDGKEFATETACQEYEMLFSDILSGIKKISKICSTQSSCENCKFSYSSGNCLFQDYCPEDWDLETLQERIGG